jgi:hypothetical protein
MSPAAEILSWICRRSTASSETGGQTPRISQFATFRRLSKTAAALDSSATNSHQRNRSKVHLERQEENQRKNNILIKQTYGI